MAWELEEIGIQFDLRSFIRGVEHKRLEELLIIRAQLKREITSIRHRNHQLASILARLTVQAAKVRRNELCEALMERRHIPIN